MAENVSELSTAYAELAARDARVEELTAELEIARMNERRYLWLRSGGPGTGLYVADSGRDWRCVIGKRLDDRVDEAIDDAIISAQPDARGDGNG